MRFEPLGGHAPYSWATSDQALRRSFADTNWPRLATRGVITVYHLLKRHRPRGNDEDSRRGAIVLAVLNGFHHGHAPGRPTTSDPKLVRFPSGFTLAISRLAKLYTLVLSWPSGSCKENLVPEPSWPKLVRLPSGSTCAKILSPRPSMRRVFRLAAGLAVVPCRDRDLGRICLLFSANRHRQMREVYVAKRSGAGAGSVVNV